MRLSLITRGKRRVSTGCAGTLSHHTSSTSSLILSQTLHFSVTKKRQMCTNVKVFLAGDNVLLDLGDDGFLSAKLADFGSAESTAMVSLPDKKSRPLKALKHHRKET